MSLTVYHPHEDDREIGTASNGVFRWADWDISPADRTTLIGWMVNNPDHRLECCAGFITARDFLDRYVPADLQPARSERHPLQSLGRPWRHLDDPSSGTITTLHPCGFHFRWTADMLDVYGNAPMVAIAEAAQAAASDEIPGLHVAVISEQPDGWHVSFDRWDC